jgi:Transposase, Mutator family
VEFLTLAEHHGGSAVKTRPGFRGSTARANYFFRVAAFDYFCVGPNFHASAGVDAINARGDVARAAWRRAWDYAVPFFAFALSIRKRIYTTNAVAALHRSLRKITKIRGSFPDDDAALRPF